MQLLYYNIGGYTIEIITENVELTIMLLSDFSSFKVPSPKTFAPLFRFSANKEILIPNVKPADILDAEGIHSKVYISQDFIFAEVRINNITRKLKATKEWRTVETDLQLTSAAELAIFKHFIVTAYGMAAAPLKTIKVHASVIEKNGKALLFIAPGGTGKSTHSRLWLHHVPGSSLLNDDEPIVRVLEEGTVRVYGAPWSGSTPCYRNASAEVAGIVHLHQSPENKLTPLDTVDAISSLMKQTSVFRSDRNNKKLVAETVFDIVSKIPVYRLDCRPDAEAIKLTEPLIK